MTAPQDVFLFELMRDVEAGRIDAQGALAQWHDKLLDVEIPGSDPVHMDLSREQRSGFPEVIYGEGKELKDLKTCLQELRATGQNVLVTRVAPKTAAAILEEFPDFVWHRRGRLLTQGTPSPKLGLMTVIAAGTTDLPVAEEAAVTATMMGAEVRRIYDVGVAGLHRLLSRRGEWQEAQVHVVVAGMEGALPSVVGGLVAGPIISVPTDVGYGASFGGIAALLGMLCSCAPGVVVVNIGNGFGAGYAACRMLRLGRSFATANHQVIEGSQ